MVAARRISLYTSKLLWVGLRPDPTGKAQALRRLHTMQLDLAATSGRRGKGDNIIKGGREEKGKLRKGARKIPKGWVGSFPEMRLSDPRQRRPIRAFLRGLSGWRCETDLRHYWPLAQNIHYLVWYIPTPSQHMNLLLPWTTLLE